MSHDIFLNGRVQLCCGDGWHFLRDQPDGRYDSVVTDPPYALTFMGKTWDTGEVAFDPAFWVEVLRVLKPGGHIVAFSGTRTYHRLVCAIEDAGFEIRDQIGWAYGSGFPKSHDVSKGIDKVTGAERKVIGEKRAGLARKVRAGGEMCGGEASFEHLRRADITSPATPEAAQWQGWGTALKPSWEPIVLARKPLIGTVAANVLRRDNLRDATRSQNNMNMRKKSLGEFKGISRSGSGKWFARIGYNGKEIYGGSYDQPADAARAYDRLALQYFGEYARLNFPVDNV